MKLQFKTNAFDLDVKDMAAEMGITKQFLYKIYDNKMNVSEKRAKEMLNILKHLDAEAEKNEEVNIIVVTGMYLCNSLLGAKWQAHNRDGICD